MCGCVCVCMCVCVCVYVCVCMYVFNTSIKTRSWLGLERVSKIWEYFLIRVYYTCIWMKLHDNQMCLNFQGDLLAPFCDAIGGFYILRRRWNFMNSLYLVCSNYFFYFHKNRRFWNFEGVVGSVPFTPPFQMESKFGATHCFPWLSLQLNRYMD